MTGYQNVKLDKAMYKDGESFAHKLERLDPSSDYKDSGLGGLDAYQRQLKRFDIRVGGSESDAIQKFFSTADSAALFPEYVARAVRQGVDESEILTAITASKTKINSMDYRTISTDQSDGDMELKEVLEGGMIPQTTIKLRESLVALKKRGRMLCASFEAIKFQKLDLFTVALRQIGNYIAKSQLADAVQVLLYGDDGQSPAEKMETAATTLAYADLVKLWGSFATYELNTMLASPDMTAAILNLPEFKQTAYAASDDFKATGKLVTPFGAKLIQCAALPAGTIIGLDKRFALQMVVASDVAVDYDKLIDCQLERAAITSIAGFARVFPGAVKVLGLRA